MKKKESRPLYSSSSLSLSFDSRLKTNEGKKGKGKGRKEGRKIQNEENYRKQWGGEKKKKRKNAGRNGMKGRERERSARVRVIRVHPVC